MVHICIARFIFYSTASQAEDFRKVHVLGLLISENIGKNHMDRGWPLSMRNEKMAETRKWLKRENGCFLALLKKGNSFWISSVL